MRVHVRVMEKPTAVEPSWVRLGLAMKRAEREGELGRHVERTGFLLEEDGATHVEGGVRVRVCFAQRACELKQLLIAGVAFVSRKDCVTRGSQHFRLWLLFCMPPSTLLRSLLWPRVHPR
jgi:hypothetical protein